MATISIFRQRLKAIANEQLIISLVFDQINRYKGILIDLVQLQLEKGENPKNEVVGTYKRATEIESLLGKVKPIQPKKEGDPYNFEWTGGFFDGMFLEVGKDEAQWGSDDYKTEELEKKYGELLGLQIKNFIEAKEQYLLPGFIQEVKKILDV